MQLLSPLERCINPLNLEEFLNQYWEKAPFINLKTEREETFSDLLSLSAVDEIISSSNLRHPFFRLIKSGNLVPVENCTTEWIVGVDRECGLADLNIVYDQYASGATVELQVMERNCLSLMVFCNLLEKQLRCPTRAIIYLTPEKSSGFPAHFDTHDTIILQIAGVKRWKIWRDPLHLPLPAQYDTVNSNLVREEVNHQPPLHDIVMHPGDTVYLPRGYIHQAFTEDSYSLSISIGIMVHRWIDVLTALVKDTLTARRSDSRYQKGIFEGSFLTETLTSPGAHEVFENLVKDLMSDFDFDRGQKLVEDKFIASRRPSARGRLLDLEVADQITLETTAFKRLEVVSWIEKRVDFLLLNFQGTEERFDIYLLEALRFIDSRDSFHVGEIPSDISDNERISLVTRLVRYGYLTLQSQTLGVAVRCGRV